VSHHTDDAWSVQYASPFGNDANDGKSWATAKFAMEAAACSLYLGNCTTRTTGYGHVYFAEGTHAWASSTAYGLRMMTSGDPAFNSTNPPAGWMNSTGQTFGFSGVGCGSHNQGLEPACSMVGTTADGVSIQTSSMSEPQEFQDIVTGGQVLVGICSDYTRANSCGSVTETFRNVQANGTLAHGSAFAVGANSFWIHFFECGWQAYNIPATIVSTTNMGLSRASGIVTVTTTAPHAFSSTSGATTYPFPDRVLIEDADDPTFDGTFVITGTPTSTSFTYLQTGLPNATSERGAAIVDRNFGGDIDDFGAMGDFTQGYISVVGGEGHYGGWRWWNDGGNGDGMVFQGYIVEGDFAVTAPAFAYDSHGGSILMATVDQIRLADNAGVGNTAVIDPSAVAFAGGLRIGSGIDVFGPGQVGYPDTLNQKNPLTQSQYGMFRGHLYGVPPDAGESTPIFVRYPNLFNTSVATLETNCTNVGATPALYADHQGGMNGVSCTSAGGTPLQWNFSSVALTSVHVGDYIVVAERAININPHALGNRGTSPDAIAINDLSWGGDTVTYAAVPNLNIVATGQGDSNYEWVLAVRKIATTTSSTPTALWYELVDNIRGRIVDQSSMMFLHIPYNDPLATDNEVVNLAATLRSYPSTAAVGEMWAGPQQITHNISGLTTGFIPKAGSATTISANSACDDSVTTATTITCTEPLVATSLTATGSGAGVLQLGNGSAPSLLANGFSFFAPVTITTGFGWSAPAGENASAGLLHLAAAASHISAATVSAVTSADMAVVNTRQTCDIPVGDTSASALANAQLGPQSRICYIPAAATIVEMDVNADAGTPNVIVGRNHAGTIANVVSAALATAASGGIACTNTGGTTGIDGATTCTNTLQNTSLSAGDYLELVSGTAGGTAKFFVVHVIYTIN
jgi:hypothetical protein